jgi:hypothetical protein
MAEEFSATNEYAESVKTFLDEILLKQLSIAVTEDLSKITSDTESVNNEIANLNTQITKIKTNIDSATTAATTNPDKNSANSTLKRTTTEEMKKFTNEKLFDKLLAELVEKEDIIADKNEKNILILIKDKIQLLIEYLQQFNVDLDNNSYSKTNQDVIEIAMENIKPKLIKINDEIKAATSAVVSPSSSTSTSPRSLDQNSRSLSASSVLTSSTNNTQSTTNNTPSTTIQTNTTGTFNINIFYENTDTIPEKNTKNISIVFSETGKEMSCKGAIDVLTIPIPFKKQSTVSLIYMNVFFQCLRELGATYDTIKNKIILDNTKKNNITNLLKQIVTTTDIYLNNSVSDIKQQFFEYQTKINGDLVKIQDGITANKTWLPDIVINSVRDSIAIISKFEHECLKKYPDLEKGINTDFTKLTKVSPQIQIQRDSITDLFGLRKLLFSAAAAAAEQVDEVEANTQISTVHNIMEQEKKSLSLALQNRVDTTNGGKTNTTRKSKLRRRKSERRKKPKKNV